jgi:hypothetical protein
MVLAQNLAGFAVAGSLIAVPLWFRKAGLLSGSWSNPYTIEM